VAAYSKMTLFDLDHTLLKGNSSYYFGKYLCRKRVLSLWQVPYMLVCYCLHKMHVLSISALHERIFSVFFQRQSVSSIALHAEAFLEQELQDLIYMPAFSLLQRAQKEGEFVAILSNSPDFLVSAIGRKLGVSQAVGTVYGVDEEGCFSHVASLLDGQAKALMVNEMCAQMSIDSASVTVYSDSILDLPFLMSAGKAVAANPDRKLRALCKSRGWKII
jgi:HAD superfamily hydrolase (TIGR01490 family)